MFVFALVMICFSNDSTSCYSNRLLTYRFGVLNLSRQSSIEHYMTDTSTEANSGPSSSTGLQTEPSITTGKDLIQNVIYQSQEYMSKHQSI